MKQARGKRASMNTVGWGCLIALGLMCLAVLVGALGMWWMNRPDVTYTYTPSPDGRYVAITAHIFNPQNGTFDAAWIALPDTAEDQWHEIIPMRSGRTGWIEARWESNQRVVFQTRHVRPRTLTWKTVSVEVREGATSHEDK